MKRSMVVVLFLISLASVSVNADPSGARAKARLGKIAAQAQPVKQLQPMEAAATADFLTVPGHCAAVKRHWQRQLSSLGNTIIRQMLENEERYQDDYFVFYHAQISDNFLVVEFLKNLYEFEYHTMLRSDFEFLRFWQNGSRFADVNAYLDSFGVPSPFSFESFVLSDHHPDIRQFLLAVNPVLFGNFDWYAECTFEFFIKNQSVYRLVQSILTDIFKRYGFDDRYIKSLIAIDKKFKRSSGDIIQIFIPKGSVNDVAYLSGPGGVPEKELLMGVNGKPIVPADYDLQRRRYAKSSRILEIIQNNIGMIKSSRQLQFRLFFAQSGPLLNPDMGVKIFRFASLTPAEVHEYAELVKILCQKIFFGKVGFFNQGFSDQPRSSSVIAQGKDLTSWQKERVSKVVGGLAVPAKTLFDVMGREDDVAMMGGLLAVGADINMSDGYGRTVLMLATVKHRIDIVKLLVNNNANLNVQDKYGWTALMWAARGGDAELVHYLVDAGADATIHNKQGRVAWQVAQERNHQEIALYLKDQYVRQKGLVRPKL